MEEDDWWGDGPEDLLLLANELRNGDIELAQYQIQQILRKVASSMEDTASRTRSLENTQDAACDAWCSYLHVAEKGLENDRTEQRGEQRAR